MGIHKINYMPDEEITKNLRRMFNCRHLLPSDAELIRSNDFIESCKNTAEGRLLYAAFEPERAHALLEQMSKIQRVIFRATLDGIKVRNDDVFNMYISEDSSEKFVKMLVTSFAVTCLNVKYVFGAKELLTLYEKFDILKPYGPFTDSILRFINLLYKDLFDKKYKKVPNICQF